MKRGSYGARQTVHPLMCPHGMVPGDFGNHVIQQTDHDQIARRRGQERGRRSNTGLRTAQQLCTSRLSNIMVPCNVRDNVFHDVLNDHGHVKCAEICSHR